MARLQGEPGGWPRLRAPVPPRERPWLLPAAWVVLAMLYALLPGSCGVAEAGDEPLPAAVAAGWDGPVSRAEAGADTAVLMARLRVAELDFRAGLRAETAAMYWIVRRRAELRGKGYRDALIAYSGDRLEPPDDDEDPERSRPWLAYLDASGEPPRHWPPHVRWYPYRDGQMRAYVDLAEDWLRGRVGDPCPEADHWGSSSPELPDVGRAERAGWRRVCTWAHPGLAFWAVPDRGPRAEGARPGPGRGPS